MTGYYQDAISEAAALMESLAINHPFIDGNKRMAFAATDVFLRINGWRLMGESSEIYRNARKAPSFRAGMNSADTLVS